MQATIIFSFLGYLLLVFQLKRATTKGAKDLEQVLAKGSLDVLIQRNAWLVAAMFFPVLCSFFTMKNSLQLQWPKDSLSIVLLLTAVVFMLSTIGGFHFKPLQRIQRPYSAITYIVTRAIGLVLYEIFFRGVVLGAFLLLIGITWSVIINILLYVLAHAFASKRDLIGSIPFGLLSCFVTVYSHSVYPAILIHLALALPYEIILLNRSTISTQKVYV